MVWWVDRVYVCVCVCEGVCVVCDDDDDDEENDDDYNDDDEDDSICMYKLCFVIYAHSCNGNQAYGSLNDR